MDAHPVRITVHDDLRRSRLTVFFRLLLAIPHLVWLVLWSVAALVAGVVNWFAVLITGRTPRPLHRFLAAYIRYSTQVGAFIGLAANPFPGFVGDPRYPVSIEIAEPQAQRRLVTLFKLVLIVPAAVIAGILGGDTLSWGGLAGAASFLAWFAALVKGRMPSGLRDVLVWALGYSAQLSAYFFSLTDRYPTSDPNEHVRNPAPERSVRLELDDDGRRSRLTVFFRLLLAIPHLVWLYLWGVVVSVAAVVGWIAALVLGRLPAPLHRFSAVYVSYAAQVYAYIFLIANPFPGFVGARFPLRIVIDPPAPQNRLVTLFRLLLALPAFLIAGALAYLLYVIAFLGWFAALATGRMPIGMRSAGAAAIRYMAQTYSYTLLLTAQYPHSSPALSAHPDVEPVPDSEPFTAPTPEPEAIA
jgi:uncharacterized protein DUF4389